ncbi:MAG: flagellar basal body-associated protein FliL [Gammaproteobacteria bacterium]
MAAEDTQETPTTEESSGGGMVKTLGIAVGLFALMIASQLVGPMLACKFMRDTTPGCPALPEPTEDEILAELGPPIYLALDPPMVVSFEDQEAIRFLQVTIEVMSREEEAIQAVNTHLPLIRNNLLMLMGGQSVAELTNTEGKEALRQEALKEVRSILKRNTGDAGIEDLYFTTFVVQ